MRDQPKYQLFQDVKLSVKTKDEKSGMEFENIITAKISVIRATGTSEKDTYEYGVTTDVPGCYHSGKPPFLYILEDNIIVQ